MHHAVIAATGLYTPPESVSNAELVEAFNTYVERFNAANAEAIEAGQVAALTPSSVEFIVKASGIKSRHVVNKSGIVDPEIIDRVGPYHLFVGVTDVASARRFDSREYYSLLTSSTVETRDDSDPTGTLELTIANPDDEATNQTRIELQAEISGGNAAAERARSGPDNPAAAPHSTTPTAVSTTRPQGGRLRLPNGCPTCAAAQRLSAAS